MCEKSIIIYFNGGMSNEYYNILFSTKENAINKLPINEIDSIIGWLENSSMVKKIECINGKKYCLFKQNINYVEIIEE